MFAEQIGYLGCPRVKSFILGVDRVETKELRVNKSLREAVWEKM